MNSQTLTEKAKREALQEAQSFELLLSHVNERLTELKPGINCTKKQYQSLIDEKLLLTLALKAAIIRSKGYTFVEESDGIYSYNNIILKLGGVFRQKIRA